MDIISTIETLLPFGADVCPKVALIGRLVGREADVAVETVDTILGREVGNRGVEQGYCSNELVYTVLKILFARQVLVFVSLEPLTVVVGRHIGQKGYDSIGIQLSLLFLILWGQISLN